MCFVKELDGVNNKEKLQIIVIGRNYCNILAMTKAFGLLGYKVDIIRVFKVKPNPFNVLRKMKPEAYSKYVKRYHQCVADNDLKKIVNFLVEMADLKSKRILIPVDDYTVYAIDKNFDQLSEYYEIPNIDKTAGKIVSLMDKNQQKNLAKNFDIPMLHSNLIKSENEKFKVPLDISYPCYIKPNISMKSTKAKMRKCNDREELIKTLKEYAKTENFEILIEDFADIKAEYSIMGFSAEGKTIIPGIFRTIEGGHKERKGIAMTGETISSSRFDYITNRCIRFIDSLHYTGIFDIDLIETNDGYIFFIEVNFRAGSSMHIFTESGVNLPGMYLDYLMKGIVTDEECSAREEGKKFINEKVLVEEYVRNDVNLYKAINAKRNIDVCFIKDKQDIRPYRYFKRFYCAIFLFRILYQIRDRVDR